MNRLALTRRQFLAVIGSLVASSALVRLSRLESKLTAAVTSQGAEYGSSTYGGRKA